MTKLTLAAFSLTQWFSSAWTELSVYVTRMNTTQWGIVAASTVAFGFLCLRGTQIRN